MNVFSSGIFSFVLCGVLANLRDKMTDGSGLAIFLVKEIFSTWSNENKKKNYWVVNMPGFHVPETLEN